MTHMGRDFDFFMPENAEKSFVNDSTIFYPLRSRSKNKEEDLFLPLKSHTRTNFLETEVQEDDTLQSLALKYNCNISELKRLNNILNDNEVFSKGKIKIPFNFQNIDLLEKEKIEKLNKLQNERESFKKIIISDVEKPPDNFESIDLHSKYVINKAIQSLNNSKTIEILEPNAPAQQDIFLINDESQNLLPKSDSNQEIDVKSNFYNINVKKKTPREDCFQPSECGMKLWIAVLLMVAICIALPLLIIFYFIEEKSLPH